VRERKKVPRSVTARLRQLHGTKAMLLKGLSDFYLPAHSESDSLMLVTSDF
jgi:hypothetical protein